MDIQTEIGNILPVPILSNTDFAIMTTTAASSNETGKLDPAFQNESEIIGYVEPWIASPGQQVEVKVSYCPMVSRVSAYRTIGGRWALPGQKRNAVHVTNFK